MIATVAVLTAALSGTRQQIEAILLVLSPLKVQLLGQQMLLLPPFIARMLHNCKHTFIFHLLLTVLPISVYLMYVLVIFTLTTCPYKNAINSYGGSTHHGTFRDATANRSNLISSLATQSAMVSTATVAFAVIYGKYASQLLKHFYFSTLINIIAIISVFNVSASHIYFDNMSLQI
jgi:hypothetical protein